jgi:hypothetical protein
MGYNKMVLHGHDYSHSRYFWFNGDSKWGEVHCRYNKESKTKKDSDPHHTIRVLDFISDFNKRHMIPKGREIYIGSAKSMLCGRLKLWEWGKK